MKNNKILNHFFDDEKYLLVLKTKSSTLEYFRYIISLIMMLTEENDKKILQKKIRIKKNQINYSLKEIHIFFNNKDSYQLTKNTII